MWIFQKQRFFRYIIFRKIWKNDLLKYGCFYVEFKKCTIGKEKVFSREIRSNKTNIVCISIYFFRECKKKAVFNHPSSLNVKNCVYVYRRKRLYRGTPCTVVYRSLCSGFGYLL